MTQCAETARHTIALIHQIKQQMADCQLRMRVELPKIYRKQLLENLFKHPYTKIDFIIEDLGVSRLTAAKYLELLTAHGFLHKAKMGRSNFYMNHALFDLLANGSLENSEHS